MRVLAPAAALALAGALEDEQVLAKLAARK
jgi:hypothetical protein